MRVHGCAGVCVRLGAAGSSFHKATTKTKTKEREQRRERENRERKGKRIERERGGREEQKGENRKLKVGL